MTGQDLIDLITKHQLEDFEMVASFAEPSTNEWGISYRTFAIDRIIADIGHSDKKAKLSIVEEF